MQGNLNISSEAVQANWKEKCTPGTQKRGVHLSQIDSKVEYQRSNDPNIGKYQTKPGTDDIRLWGYEANNSLVKNPGKGVSQANLPFYTKESPV